MTDRPKRRPAGRGRAGGSREDDRPRGFQPQRMRRLWQDIDRARDGLGLGPGEEPPSPLSWTMAGILGRMTDLASGLLWWMGKESPSAPPAPAADRTSSRTRDESKRGETAVCALAERGIDILRQVPILGRLLTLVSPESRDGAQRDTIRR